MDARVFTVLDWTIENFACWNAEVHDRAITSHEFSSRHALPRLRLFPRGAEGRGDLLELEVVWGDCQQPDCSGDISLVGPDGHVFCNQPITDDVLIILQVRFADIVTRTRMSEKKHEDRLTVKVRLARSAGSSLFLYTRTLISAHATSVRISGQITDKLQWPNRREALVSTIKYPTEDGEATLRLYAVGKGVDIDLMLEVMGTRKNSLICTRTSVLNGKTVTRTEEAEHVFRDEKRWTFSSSIKTAELRERSVLVLIKEVPGDMHHLQCEYHSSEPKFADVTPTVSLRHFAPVDEDEDPSEFLDAEFTTQVGNSVHVLTRDLTCLYQGRDFSDLTLNCGAVAFPVHKVILSARSPVFKTQISTECRCLDIGDVDPSTMGRFLSFLYTGAVGEEDLQGESVLNLYYAANKYQVPSLKKECADFLCSNVSASNVLDVLCFADTHRDDQLTSAARDFIRENYNDVLRSEEWKDFMKKEPVLAVETLTSFAEKNSVVFKPLT